MPGDDPVPDGLPQQLRVLALFQVELNEERAHGPDKVFLAVLVASPGGGNGPGDEGLHIAVEHRGGGIGKADVQVGFVNDKNFFNSRHSVDLRSIYHGYYTRGRDKRQGKNERKFSGFFPARKSPPQGGRLFRSWGMPANQSLV